MREVNFVGSKRFVQGQDGELEFRVVGEEYVKVRLNTAAGATSLPIEPLVQALSNGHRLYFERAKVVVTLTGAGVVGATSLSISALLIPLVAGDSAFRIIDISSWTLRWRLQRPYINDVELTKTTGGGITITDAANGLLKVAIAALDTNGFPLEEYHQDLWRTDSGFTIPLAQGRFQLAET